MHRLLALCTAALLTGCVDDLPPWVALLDAGSPTAPDAAPDPAVDGDAPPSDAKVGVDLDPPTIDQGAIDSEPAADLGVGDQGTSDADPPDADERDMAADMASDATLDFDVPDFEPPDLDVPDLELPDLELPDLELPDLELPDLELPDAFVPPIPEVCNGIDDDRNGIVDDAPVCGGVIAGRCRVFLGLANGVALNGIPLPSWDTCPGSATDGYAFNDAVACVGTRYDGTFRRIGFSAFDTFNENNHIAIALLCDHAAAGPVEEWIESQCRVYLGQADSDAANAAEVYDRWATCPEQSGREGSFQCITSGGDGRFHYMSILGTVDGNDDFAAAFRCDDATDPERAAAMQRSASFVLGWARRSDDGSPDFARTWGPDCPGPGNAALDNGGDTRCASSAFDGRFHHFGIEGVVSASVDDFGFGGYDAFGIALLPHPDAPPPPP